MKNDTDRAIFNRYWIDRQRKNGYGAGLTDAEMLAHPERQDEQFHAWQAGRAQRAAPVGRSLNGKQHPVPVGRTISDKQWAESYLKGVEDGEKVAAQGASDTTPQPVEVSFANRVMDAAGNLVHVSTVGQPVEVQPVSIKSIISDIRAAKTMAMRDYLFDKLLSVLEAQQPTDDWKTAVLDALSTTCQDFPIGTPPSVIINAISDWHVKVALDPELSGCAQPVAQPVSEERKQLHHLVVDIAEQVRFPDGRIHYRIRFGKDLMFSNLVGAAERLLGTSKPGAPRLVKPQPLRPNPIIGLDEDDPLWLVNEQIICLLDGLAASEDHEDVIQLLRSTGLPESTVAAMHKALAEYHDNKRS